MLNAGFKIVLKTRSAGVCDQMDSKNLEVYSLAHDEAWKLFQEMIERSTLDSHTSIPELAETLARECGRLPLALKTVGRAMKSQKKVGDRERAIEKMRTSASTFSGMEENVFLRLKFSYDSLSMDKLRSCLLYCCLYPEDYKIPKRSLIDYWISEGFMADFDRGCEFINDLLHACLLEEEGDDHVKMHDMIREMSLWIAWTIEKEKKNFLVRAGVKLTEAPKVKEWEELKALEKLRYLNLEYTHYLSIIPHQLISGFLKLEVLRLLECGSEGVTKEEGNVLCDDAEPLMRELLGLKRLNVLSWSFRSSLAVQKFFKYPKLVSITQCVGVSQYENPPFNVLHLVYMENLQELDLLFINLEEMKIDSTEEDLTWLVFVQNLKELEIIVCTEMEEIICVDKLRDVSDISEIIGSEHNFFTQLESLGILYGPDLKSIYPNPLHFPKLKKIGVYGCPKLKKLPINSSSVKERRVVIEGLKEWWEELQWEDQATQNAFSSGVILGGD
ncbi:hypothetical protein CUMW_254060 [Citrus unshiu]|uniref:Uncharacterized protein n=1 Tax=Citrus unshiu TaxID=55188 RepID=A0A2H5QR79_CITUN|nr:hypothetical protein CUMW_254060 [Citrus unshiu]